MGMPAKRWGDFEIDFDRLLGRGGMGAVYRGRQVSLNRPAAIKVLKKELTTNPEFVQRFHREAALLAKLVDSHVVQVFGAGEGDGQYFYAMEVVEGEDFGSKIKKGRKFAVDEVLQVALQVSRALQAVWKHKIVHRDIKPSNIILTRDQQIKVMDFGLAKDPGSDVTQTEVIMGTAKYMSPEQATGGTCDVRSDLYSLGVVLYELATGRPPFLGESATAVMFQHVHKEPIPPHQANPAVPMELEALILRLMAKNPDLRYVSPDALISAVEAILEGVTPEEKSTLFGETLKVDPSPAPAPPAPRPSRSWPLVLSLGAAVVLVGVGGYFLLQAASTPPRPPEPPPVAARVPEKDPEPPKPPAPPAEDAWKAPLREGLDAFARRDWMSAAVKLEEARRLGATDPDVREKARQAQANELIAKGDEERDDVRALEHYQAARKFAEDDALREKIRRASFDRWQKSAIRHEGGDWTQAAADWGRAAEFAEEGRRQETQARQRFCATYSEAVKAKLAGNWKLSLEKLAELAQEPRNFASAIEAERKRAVEELDRLAELAGAEARKEFDRIAEEGRAALRRAAWVEAKAAFDRLQDPRFKDCPKDGLAGSIREAALAMAAPRGMVFVPGGKFRMGGGRDVESPEWEASVGPFYLDDRETTAGEYAQFLKSIEASGHHPGCPEKEPAGKRHEPVDWTSQRPEDPVGGVDWWDASSYAAWKRKRLPREAEWERAASFDPQGRRAYPWGDRFQKEGGRSFLGVDGLGTGVIEWTSDWFQGYPGSPAASADFGEKKKALRGGVLLDPDAERDARVTYRHWHLPSLRSRKVGFRCAQDVAER
jgi:serine/threonine protein kinase/formylglycine-generating enzyme required for sulfatase activity